MPAETGQPAAEPALEDPTDIVPATGAASESAGEAEIGRGWFDDRLRDFVQALAIDSMGTPRPTKARQALAAAAHDLIDRIANQRPTDEPAQDWPREAVFQPHQLLANTFQVRSLIASGGIGQIYRVWHRDLRTEHAIKILQPRYMLDTALSAMLMTEARMLGAVRHPGVVRCLGLLRDSDGRLLVVMDHIRGGTLSARLHEGPIPPADAVSLARHLLQTLTAIHAAGVVHNDLAPDNIMLRGDDINDPVLVDFGLARPVNAADAPETHQVAIDFAGKLSWISPERLDGAGHLSDARSDLYSLGLVLVAAATGRRLAMGTNHDTAVAARQSVPALDEVPEALRPLLTALLQPNPAERPANAEAALAVLDPRPRGAADLLARLWEGRA